MNAFAKWVSVAALALSASGCIFLGEYVDPGDPVEARFQLSWATEDAVSHRAIACTTTGADTVRVSAANQDTGELFIDLFDCRDGEGVTADLTAGDYVVDVALVRCGGDWQCSAPRVIQVLDALGVFRVYDDRDVGLGHFVFSVMSVVVEGPSESGGAAAQP